MLFKTKRSAVIGVGFMLMLTSTCSNEFFQCKSKCTSFRGANIEIRYAD